MSSNSSSKIPPAALTVVVHNYQERSSILLDNQNNNNNSPRHFRVGQILKDSLTSGIASPPSPPELSNGVGVRGYFGPEVIRPVPRFYHSEEALEEVYEASDLPKLVNHLGGWMNKTNFDRAYQINHYAAENGMSHFVNTLVKIVKEIDKYKHIPLFREYVIIELKQYWSFLGITLKVAEKKQLNEENFNRLATKLERVRLERLNGSPVGNTGSRDSSVPISPNVQSSYIHSNIRTPNGIVLLASLMDSLNVECVYREKGRVPCANDFIAVEFLKECLS